MIAFSLGGGLARVAEAARGRSPRSRRSSSRPSSPACGVSTVGQRRLRQQLLDRAAGERVEPVGVDHERHVDALAPARARAPARPSFLPSPGPSTTASARPIAVERRLRSRSGVSAPSRSGSPTIIASSSLTVNESSRDCGRADRHVARAGAHRGQRGHRRRAGQPARAADDEDVAGGELRRVRGRGAACRAARRRRSGRSRPRRARRVGMPMSTTVDARRRGPCRGGSTGPAWRWWNVAVATARTADALDLAGRGVDAARHVGRDHAARARR